jgi:hypothetical protein
MIKLWNRKTPSQAVKKSACSFSGNKRLSTKLIKARFDENTHREQNLYFGFIENFIFVFIKLSDEFPDIDIVIHIIVIFFGQSVYVFL